jgi:type IV secretion system protein VirB5
MTNKKSFKLIMVGMMLSSSLYADILGVSDAALLVKAIEQLEQLRSQYELLSQTYTNAKSQLASIESIKNYNSGHYGFGDLANSASDLKDRQWSSNTWDEALQNISGGNPSRYQELVSAYQKNHVSLDDDAYRKGASPQRLQLYKQNKAVNQTVSVQTTYVFNEINEHLKAIHDLSTQIEKTPNTKSAIDLNTRLLSEIAYIQTESLKLQTLLSQHNALMGANDIAVDSENAKFNTLPDE